MSRPQRPRPETLAIHAGIETPPEYGPVSVPIYQSATFSFRQADEGAARFAGRDPGYIYTPRPRRRRSRLAEGTPRTLRVNRSTPR